MNDPLDMPVLALTSDGQQYTTAAKALGLDTPDKLQLRKSLAELDQRIATLKPLLLKDAAVLRKKRILEDREKRITGLVKAELTRRKTAEVVARTEKTKRRIAKVRRKADALDVAKGEAEQMLADLLATQAEATAHLDDLAKRVETVYNNAQHAYGGLTRQREIQHTAELARQDQVRADWAYKAANTSDPDIRRHYQALAAGETPDADD